MSNKWLPVSDGRCKIFYDSAGILWSAVCKHTNVKPWNDVRHNVKGAITDSLSNVFVAVYKDLANG